MEKFSTSFTGYKKEEVNKFLDDVIKQVESMINNMKSKDLEIEMFIHGAICYGYSGTCHHSLRESKQKIQVKDCSGRYIIYG